MSGRSETPPTLPANTRSIPTPPVTPAATPIDPPKPVFSQPKTSVQTEAKTAPSSTTEELPKCRYREFVSKQMIGGVPIENYYCKAFRMNVRQEHCRVCQKHDK